jgi:hypothetical protein
MSIRPGLYRHLAHAGGQSVRLDSAKIDKRTRREANLTADATDCGNLGPESDNLRAFVPLFNNIAMEKTAHFCGFRALFSLTSLISRMAEAGVAPHDESKRLFS